MQRRFKLHEGPAGRFLIDETLSADLAELLARAATAPDGPERHARLLDAQCGAVLFDCRLLVMKGGDALALQGAGSEASDSHFACVIGTEALADFDLTSCRDLIGLDGVALALDSGEDTLARVELPDGHVLVWQPRKLPLGVQ